MGCKKCDGYEFFEMAEFLFNYDKYKKGYDLETDSISQKVKSLEKEARRLRKTLNKRTAHNAGVKRPLAERG